MVATVPAPVSGATVSAGAAADVEPEGRSLHAVRHGRREEETRLLDQIRVVYKAGLLDVDILQGGDFALHEGYGLVEIIRLGYDLYDGDARVLRGSDTRGEWASGCWVRISALFPVYVGLAVKVISPIPFASERRHINAGSVGMIGQMDPGEVLIQFWDLSFRVQRGHWGSLRLAEGVT